MLFSAPGGVGVCRKGGGDLWWLMSERFGRGLSNMCIITKMRGEGFNKLFTRSVTSDRHHRNLNNRI